MFNFNEFGERELLQLRDKYEYRLHQVQSEWACEEDKLYLDEKVISQYDKHLENPQVSPSDRLKFEAKKERRVKERNRRIAYLEILEKEDADLKYKLAEIDLIESAYWNPDVGYWALVQNFVNLPRGG